MNEEMQEKTWTIIISNQWELRINIRNNYQIDGKAEQRKQEAKKQQQNIL